MQPQPNIQMTLFDYFMDQDHFTLNKAIEAASEIDYKLMCDRNSITESDYETYSNKYVELLGFIH